VNHLPQDHISASQFPISNSKFTIRIAVPSDAPAVQSIYAPYVLDTAITFDTVVPEVHQLEVLIAKTLERYPWLVAESGGKVIGYACATPHRDRVAYRWCVEASVYLAPDFHGGGVALRLYEALFSILRRQGFVRCYAGITIPNPKSLRFHEKFGFQHIACFQRAGYKLGQWHDVAWLEYEIQPLSSEPQEPIPFAQR
jgi:L-amino acid N-acyltransferase YncA